MDSYLFAGERISTGEALLETPERNVKWILVVSLIMFFGSTFIAALYGVVSVSATRDVWYYLQIIVRLFFILTIGSSALCVANFARRWTYISSIFFFGVSILLLFILGLRGFF
jgi:hypothetical protein